MDEREDKEMKEELPRGLRNKEEVEAQGQSFIYCSSLLSIPGKTISKSNSGRKGFIRLTDYSPWWREAEAGVQGRNLKQKRRRNTAYWLAPSGLLSYIFFRQSRLACLQYGTAHSGLGPPASINN